MGTMPLRLTLPALCARLFFFVGVIQIWSTNAARSNAARLSCTHRQVAKPRPFCVPTSSHMKLTPPCLPQYPVTTEEGRSTTPRAPAWLIQCGAGASSSPCCCCSWSSWPQVLKSAPREDWGCAPAERDPTISPTIQPTNQPYPEPPAAAAAGGSGMTREQHMKAKRAFDRAKHGLAVNAEVRSVMCMHTLHTYTQEDWPPSHLALPNATQPPHAHRTRTTASSTRRRTGAPRPCPRRSWRKSSGSSRRRGACRRWGRTGR